MQTKLLIDGEWREAASGASFEVFNPATDTPVADVSSAGPEDVLQACQAAGVAQKKWADRSPRDRSDILQACWRSMLDHQDELAQLIVLEGGKTISDGLAEVVYAAEFLRWNAEEAVRMHGTIGMAPSGSNRIIVHHVPIGVVAVVTPWNYPAAMITRKIAPALASGNAAVVKPADETPLTALRIAELMTEAGVPPGVLNILPTNEAVSWFDTAAGHSAVRMVSFTGSTQTGRKILKRSADRVLKTVMELGGNAPFIVFDDADVDAAVAGAMKAKMRNAAQMCTAVNRFYLQSAIAEEFSEKYVAAVAGLNVGDGSNDAVSSGPLINRAAVDRVHQLVEDAVAAGATVELGGNAPDLPGYFYNPTVISNVDADDAIASEEIFGPVSPLLTFDDPEVMLVSANATEMGLVGYVYTQDLAKGLATAEKLQAGMVGLNSGVVSNPAAPFGGMKQSGLGREGASEGVYEFCEAQYIATQW